MLERQLDGRDYVADEYSIADMAIFPWLLLYEMQQQNLDDFPNVKRYIDRINARPDVGRALRRAEDFDWASNLTDAELRQLIESAD